MNIIIGHEADAQGRHTQTDTTLHFFLFSDTGGRRCDGGGGGVLPARRPTYRPSFGGEAEKKGAEEAQKWRL